MENNDFDKILRMNTEAERRRIATQAMCAILGDEASQHVAMYKIASQYPEGIAKYAVACADALITELNKKKE